MKLTPEQLNVTLQDPAWVDIGNLPSNFFPYSFKELYIRPFQTTHLRLLSRSIVEQNVAHQIRAIDLVISQDVNTLSIGDYYYLLYWLKIHSTTKTPLAVEWACPEQRLRHKETGKYLSNSPKALLEASRTVTNPKEYELVPCGTYNTELLHNTSLDIIQLPEEGWTGLPEGFDWPRVKNLAEIRDALADPELNYLVGAAQWIRVNPDLSAPETLKEKFAYLDGLPDLNKFVEAQAINDTVVHGIRESSVIKCRTCQAEHPYTVNVDSLSFFQ